MPDDAFGKHAGATRVASTQHAASEQGGAARYRTLLAAALTLAGIAGSAGAQPTTRPATRPTTRIAETSGAARAVVAFREALRANNLPAATKWIAASPQPVRDVDRRLKRLAGTLSRDPKWDFTLLDAKETGDVAVVMINDYLKEGRQTIDITPWFLIRQAGEWRLLGKFTDFELAEYGFDESRLAEYRRLEAWANDREPTLRAEQPDCGC
jgi:hypothetical protein